MGLFLGDAVGGVRGFGRGVEDVMHVMSRTVMEEEGSGKVKVTAMDARARVAMNNNTLAIGARCMRVKKR